MASKKKESEGIALLSMYGDEDDDMEEDLDNDHDDNNSDDNAVPTENKEESEVGPNEAENMEEDDSVALNNSSSMGFIYGSSTGPVINLDSANDNTTPVSVDNLTPPPLSQQVIGAEPTRGREGKLTIVDYGHDEAALSPEAEEGEIVARGRVMFGAELQAVNGTPPGTVQLLTPNRQPTPPQSSEQVDQSQSDAMNIKGNESESLEPEEALNLTEDGQKKIDPLDLFLPPPPITKCSDELQEKIIKFMLLKKKTGRSYNSEVRIKKNYLNPDFLQHAVTYQKIDEIGSCLRKDVFDPHGYDKSDFYDEIEADMKREAERKEQEKKKNQKIDFLSGGTQPPAVVAIPTPKIVPIAAPPLAVGGGGSNPVDTGTREGRPNKKSKWDKVDGDSVSSVGTHSALLSAANAGSGYTAFAQQRRREAEERRSSDRKLDRRS